MQVVFLRHLFALFSSFLIGIYFIPIIILAAKKIGFMDAADGRLKHQKEPVPYLGGLAIFISFISALGLCYPFENQMLWLLLGTTLLLCIGLIDDLKVLKPSQKFLGQFIAVLCFLKGEFSLKTPYFSSVLNVGLSGFWMLTVINAFNLVDVMDGLCGLLALISALTFMVLAYATGQYATSLLLCAFIGAICAFLMYNKPPAKIYMGDAGSLFIGGLLSTMPLLFSWDSNLFTWQHPSIYFGFIDHYVKPLFEMFFVPCIILAVPLLEVVGLFIIRSWLGIPFYKGSPHHFSIYLQKRPWSRHHVLAFAGCIAAICSIAAVSFLYNLVSWTFLSYAFVLVACGWVYVVYFQSARIIRNSVYGAVSSKRYDETIQEKSSDNFL